MTLRRLLIAVLALAPLPAAADLAGRWISLGPTHVYLVPQHIEVLQVDPDGSVAVEVWRLDPLHDLACPDATRPDCANPLQVARGRLDAAPGGAFSILPDGPVAPPFPDPFDTDEWALSSALGADGWDHEQDGDRLALTRPITLGRRDFMLTRLFHRVDADFDARLFGYLAAILEMPLPQAICSLDVIQANPDLRAAFSTFLAATASVVPQLDAARRAFFAEGRQPTDQDFDTPLFVFLRQVDGGAQHLGVPEGYDPVGWALLIDAVSWAKRDFRRSIALFPAAADETPAIRACEEALHAPVLPPAIEPPVLPPPDPAALTAAGLIAPPAAGEQDFAGVWMHAGGDRLRRFSDHLEVLRIAPDGAVSVFVHRRDPFYNAACVDANLPECNDPVEAARGRLVRDGSRLAIAGAEEVTPPFIFDRDIAGWAVLQAAMGDWAYLRAGDRLELAGEVEGAPVTRVYHRVGPAFPAAFHEFVVHSARVSIPEAGCALQAILADPDLTLGFATHMARLLPAERRFQDLRNEASARREEALTARYRTIVEMQYDQIELAGTAIVAPEEFDADEWTTMMLAGRWLSAAPEQGAALFPDAAPLLPAIEACIAGLK